MGMRKSTRQELRKLREMVRWAYGEAICYFCHESLLFAEVDHDTDDEDDAIEIVDAYNPGDGESSPMDLDVTLHHRDGNHHNNKRSNHAWAHRRCHKAFHLTERHRINRKKK